MEQLHFQRLEFRELSDTVEKLVYKRVILFDSSGPGVPKRYLPWSLSYSILAKSTQRFLTIELNPSFAAARDFSIVSSKLSVPVLGR